MSVFRTKFSVPEGVAKLVAAAGIVLAFLLYAINSEAQGASPLGLLLLGAGGFLLSFRSTLSGNFILLMAGTALLVFPFLFASSVVYTVAGVLMVAASVVALLNWWNKE